MAAKTITTTMDYRTAFTDLGLNFALNEVTRQIEVNGRQLEGGLESKIICDLWAKGAKKTENHIIRQIQYAAYDNRYHPIKKYLNSLSCDGKDYIAELCSFFDADKYFSIWLYRWLIMAIAKIINGAQCPVFILDGPQDIGKSLFVRWLCSSVPDYFTEGPILPDNKDCRLRATKNWIWEAPEFGSTTRRADVEALKAFITTGSVTERAPFERQDEKRPVLACFVGTINHGNAGFLSDSSGSRRFIVSHINKIDWQGYTEKCSPDNIWAQAYANFLIGESFVLTPLEKKLSEANNENYQVTDSLQAMLEKLFEIEAVPQTFTPVADIIESLQSEGYRAGSTDSLSRKLSETLASLGVEKKRQRITSGKNAVYGYFGLKRII